MIFDHSRHLLSILKDAANDWVDDGAMRLSSSLAYYAIFSLAPLLVILISVAGLLFEEDAARGQISQQIATLAGRGAGEAIQAAVQSSAARKSAGVWATVLSTALLFFGASTVFAELKDALNSVWGVVVKPGRPFLTLLHDRFFSFSIVLAIGFLLLVSLVISVLLAAFSHYLSGHFQLHPAIWQVWDLVVSFAVVSGLFAMIFKLLPNVRLRWRDVWLGAVATSLLFSLGKLVIGYYLATSSIASSFGAAGSVVIVLAWIYYSACILFFGAEITKGYVRKFGSGIVPNSRAVLVDDLLRARLGVSTATIVAASTPPNVPPPDDFPAKE
ncbi:MAG TPA: YihY/virulence factor BrkB family protein [Chthoniobacteraceae bacterium]|jgi:membrane protein|nr:putative ribonuclease [Chthoniobacter sp.]HEV7867772.1 YihY/virulence factor BrkB family protein [Chthoniobacteraceae bacterium]